MKGFGTFLLGASLLGGALFPASMLQGQEAAAATANIQAEAPMELFHTGMRLEDGRLELRCAEAVQTERGTLRIKLKPGHAWPEVCLKAPDGQWDLSRYGTLHMRVSNVGPLAANMGWRIDNKGADGNSNCLQVQGHIVPGQSYEYIVPIVRKTILQSVTDSVKKSLEDITPLLPGQAKGLTVKMFGMRGYPAEVGGSMGNRHAIDPSKVLCVRMFGHNLAEPIEIEIERIWVSGAPSAAPQTVKLMDPEKFFPCIDTFGQYIHREWPGKVHSLEELRGRIAEEERDLTAHPGPSGWNKWGGWEAGPQLKATGFFRVEKYQGKWWLVDPDGRLFISHGTDCVTAYNSTPIDDREHWFQDFPGNDVTYKAFWGKQWHVVNGYYQGKQPRVFNISGANVMRKYGDNWEERFSDVTHRRLRSWGMNTIANWSSEKIYLQRRTPYFACVGTSGRRIEGSQGYWGKFVDVYAPEFEQEFRKRMWQQQGKSANDPWCIGYFVDNEMSWGSDVSLAEAALLSKATQPAKQVFVANLREKYAEIERLNAVWGTQHASWDALLESTVKPPAEARQDLLDFSRKTARQYFRIVRNTIKEVAPHQLYAGCRFAWANRIAVEAAADYCDIVSYNLYRRDVSKFRCLSGKDVPIVIGEFHFGALDRGMFHTGLVSTNSQQDRAEAYYKYVKGVLENPQLLGCHWFKYMDEPCTGRGLDGENYQIGFLDIADTPYQETVDKCREIGYKMYEHRLKSK